VIGIAAAIELAPAVLIASAFVEPAGLEIAVGVFETLAADTVTAGVAEFATDLVADAALTVSKSLWGRRP
jgi:hypothetical protein